MKRNRIIAGFVIVILLSVLVSGDNLEDGLKNKLKPPEATPPSTSTTTPITPGTSAGTPTAVTSTPPPESIEAIAIWGYCVDSDTVDATCPTITDPTNLNQVLFYHKCVNAYKCDAVFKTDTLFGTKKACQTEGDFYIDAGSYCASGELTYPPTAYSTGCPGYPCKVFTVNWDLNQEDCACKTGSIDNWLIKESGDGNGNCCGDDPGEDYYGIGYTACVDGVVVTSGGIVDNQAVCESGESSTQGVCDQHNEKGCWAPNAKNAAGLSEPKCCGDDGFNDNFDNGYGGKCVKGVYILNGDASSVKCEAVAGTGRWNLGGDADCDPDKAEQTVCCCGDDNSEFYNFRDGIQLLDSRKYYNFTLTPITKPYDVAWADVTSKTACCNSDVDCVDGNGDCVSHLTAQPGFNNGNDNTSLCFRGGWADCDWDNTTCSQCGLEWTITGENTVIGEYKFSTADTPDSGCCGDDKGEFFSYRKGAFNDYSDSACCSASTDCVWDNVCYASGPQQHIIENRALICTEGDWSEVLELKYRWDEMPAEDNPCLNNVPKTCGYCNNNSACFLETAADGTKCVHSGAFRADHFCENGHWTSRTKLLALQMLELATDTTDDFTLFCDDFPNVLNYFQYSVAFYPAEDYLKGTGNEYAGAIYQCQDDDTSEDDYCVNKVCTLVYNENGVEKVVFGTTLNQPLEYEFSDTTYPFLTLIGSPVCSNPKIYTPQESLYGEYYSCSAANADRLWYNSKIQSVVYSNKQITLSNELSLWQKFLAILRKPFDVIFLKIKTAGTELMGWEFITHSKNFQKLYIAKYGVRSIQGIIEEDISSNILGEDFMSVTYNCLSSDICSAVSNYDRHLRDWSYRGGESIQCAYDYVATKGAAYVKYTLGDQAQDAELGFRTWIDLTAKVRLHDEGTIPIKAPAAHISYPENGARFTNADPDDPTVTVDFKGFYEGCQMTNGPGSFIWNIAKIGSSNAGGSWIGNTNSYKFISGGTYKVALIVSDSTNTAKDEITIEIGLCPDGNINPGEECDDNNNVDGDGCTNCRLDAGYAAGTSGPALLCGNGVIDPSEFCDDGNIVDNDGCSSACRIGLSYSCSGEPSTCELKCGNGYVEGIETCDDKARCTGGTVCSSNKDCPAGESCSPVSGDGCSKYCTIEPGYGCSGEPSVCYPLCGNGELDKDEECDNGGNCTGDHTVGCIKDSDCAGAGDDCITMPGDGCAPDCIVEPYYECSGEPSYCTLLCGNGHLDPCEYCDDNDNDDNDGCSAECTVETGYVCTGTSCVLGIVSE
ncbi:MAG: DUF4215 domain-containing protein [Nanoarchaeota archaeon]